jgi:hypothetical protein
MTASALQATAGRAHGEDGHRGGDDEDVEQAAHDALRLEHAQQRAGRHRRGQCREAGERLQQAAQQRGRRPRRRPGVRADPGHQRCRQHGNRRHDLVARRLRQCPEQHRGGQRSEQGAGGLQEAVEGVGGGQLLGLLDHLRDEPVDRRAEDRPHR